MRRILLILLISLITGCASTQPGRPISPLHETNRPTVAEAPIQPLLASPVASQIKVTPTQTPAPAKSAERRQLVATPTRIVADFSQTDPRSVAEIQNQLSRLVAPLIDSLSAIVSSPQESLSAELSLTVQPWESARVQHFLPLIFNQPDPRPARARALFNCEFAYKIPRNECETLLLFYLDTNGPQWREQRNWLRHPDPCTWGGMQCYGGHVKVLQVEDNRLTGTLTPEIDNLPITFLLLANNSLRGFVPDSIVKMTQLEAIDLSQNQLVGPLHPDIAKFHDLRTFNFDRDKLWFDTNAFTCDSVTTIPKSECETLVAIYRSMGGDGWDVKTIYSPAPTGQGYLFADEWLVGPNPCWWKGINCVEKRLDILNLADSNLWGRVSPEFGKLTNLGQLNLSQNHLYGPIPIEFKNMTMLHYLRLGGNLRPPAVADDPTAHLCIPGAVFLGLKEILSAEDMPPGGFCPESN